MRRRWIRRAWVLSLLGMASCGGEEAAPDSSCGNGEREGVEECDDGNALDGDGCSADCRLEDDPDAGADGEADADDADRSDDADDAGDAGDVEDAEDADDASETAPVCGNAVVEPGEDCDDGNAVAADGCEGDCRYTCVEAAACDDREPCNGVETCAAHVCRDGTPPAPGTACTLATGGDGVCRDGVCALPACGDGRLEGGEACDDGNTEAGDGCRADCRGTELCGDALLDGGEACDDGNTEAGDGCRADCRGTELCGDALLDGGEACDDGLLDGSYGGCNADCTLAAHCGDGTCGGPEDCARCFTDCGGCCRDSLPITCGETLRGTTVGAPREWGSGGTAYSCAGDTTGGEDLFTVWVGSAQTVTVTLTPDRSTEDLELLALRDCAPGSCFAASTLPPGSAETLTFTVAPGESVHLAVDGWEGGTTTGSSDFTIAVTCEEIRTCTPGMDRWFTEVVDATAGAGAHNDLGVGTAGNLFVSYLMATAAAFAWKAPGGSWHTEILDAAGVSANPGTALDVDGTGAVHVVWGSWATGAERLSYARRNLDGSWLRETIAPHTAWDASIEVDAAGGVHVAYCHQRSASYLVANVAYAYRAPGGGWSTADLYGSRQECGADISLAPDGTLYIGFVGDHPYQSLLAVNAGGGWTIGGMTTGTNHSRMVCESDARGVHALWHDGYAGATVYAFGGTGAPSYATEAAPVVGYAELVADAAGTLHAVGVSSAFSGTLVHARRPVGAGWTTETIAGTTPGGLPNPRVEWDPSGDVHYTYRGNFMTSTGGTSSGLVHTFFCR